MFRKQYAKPWKNRVSLKEIGVFEHEVTSKYRPHQGKKEMARRRKQMGISFGQYIEQGVIILDTEK